MSTKFGWCFGPEGSTGDHDSCPYEIGAGGSILRCGCACHESGESAQNASEIRGFSAEVRENVASPQGALTPAGSDHPPLLENERG